MLALLTGIVILFFDKKKILTSLFAALILLLAVTPIKDRISLDLLLYNARISTNLVTFEIIKDYPVFGIGFGMQTYDNKNFLMPYYQKIPVEYRSERLIGHPHNLFLDMAVRTGFLGLALLLYLLVNAFRMDRTIMSSVEGSFFRNWGRCLLAALVAILIQGMFEPTLSGPPAIVLYAIFGMITILWRLQRAEAYNLDSVIGKVKTEI